MAPRLDLVATLHQLAPRLETLFRRYGVAPADATTILDEAVLEVQLRAAHTPDCAGRLLRAVERGCRERLKERRRQAVDALDRRRRARLDAPAGRADR